MFRWVADVGRGDWIRPRLGPFGSGVGSVVPRGFEAYTRVLHRAADRGITAVRWAQVAATTGTVLHPTAQWSQVARRGQPGEWPGGDPVEGALDHEQLTALVGLLRGFTDPDTVTAAFWNGSSWEGGRLLATAWAEGRTPLWRVPPLRRLAAARRMRQGPPTGPDIDPAVLASPRLELPAREYILLAGALDDVATLATGTATADVAPFRPGDRTPSLLWPDDHSWCVATEVDLDSTLVGGPDALIDAVLADATLEAFGVSQDDRLGAFDDEVNR
jgi:hypothetical protein